MSKKDGISDSEFSQAIEQAFGNATSPPTRPRSGARHGAPVHRHCISLLSSAPRHFIARRNVSVNRSASAKLSEMDRSCGSRWLVSAATRLATGVWRGASFCVKPTGQDNYGVRCIIVKLSTRLTPYFWINVNDSTHAVCGLIELTNLHPPEAVGGYHLVLFSAIRVLC